MEFLEPRLLLADPPGGPFVQQMRPSGMLREPFDHFDVLFDEMVDADTFTANDISITGPNGPVAPVSVAPVFSAEHTFRAWIDGTDRLIVQANTVQWRHLEWERPGLWGGHNDPTYVDEQPWMPDWPGGDYSSTYTLLQPPLPGVDMSISIEVTEGRGSVAVVQQPADANDYTLIIELYDPQGGASWYQFSTHASAGGQTAGQDSNTFRVSFPLQDALGSYAVTVGPDIRNPAGNAMDQSQDGTPGQPDDAYQATLDLPIMVELRAGSDTGVSQTDHITSAATPVVDVSVGHAGLIEVDFDGDGTFDSSLSAAAAGTYTFTPGTPLTDGMHSLTARLSPTVGDPLTAVLPVTIDTHGPTVAEVKPGSTLCFDGVDDYLLTPNLHGSFASDKVTLETWFCAEGPGVIVAELGQPTPNTGWHDSQIEILPSGEVKARRRSTIAWARPTARTWAAAPSFRVRSTNSASGTAPAATPRSRPTCPAH